VLRLLLLLAAVLTLVPLWLLLLTFLMITAGFFLQNPPFSSTLYP
jgi:hypothetical protein